MFWKIMGFLFVAGVLLLIVLFFLSTIWLLLKGTTYRNEAFRLAVEYQKRRGAQLKRARLERELQLKREKEEREMARRREQGRD